MRHVYQIPDAARGPAAATSAARADGPETSHRRQKLAWATAARPEQVTVNFYEQVDELHQVAKLLYDGYTGWLDDHEDLRQDYYDWLRRTNSGQLSCAAAIDRAGDQLISEAAAERQQANLTPAAVASESALRTAPSASANAPSRQAMDLTPSHSDTRTQPEAEAEP